MLKIAQLAFEYGVIQVRLFVNAVQIVWYS